MRHMTSADGFSLVEVIVALFILSVGVLAMGASTGHIMAQIQSAELRTERMTAVREAAEILRGSGFGNLESVCADAANNFGTEHFGVTCTVAQPSTNLKVIEMVTTGPGFQNGRIVQSLEETSVISVAN